MKMKSKIVISRSEWDSICETAVEDKENKNALKVSVKCGKIFEKQIQVIEKSDVKLNVKHARIYGTKMKQQTNYFIAQGYCAICKIKYVISIQNEININIENYVEINFDRENDQSDHELLTRDKVPQIRGSDREKIKTDSKNSGQTTKDFRYELINDGSSHIPSEDVLRRITHEEKHKFDLCKDLCI